jgi:5-methylcytosine-specific restriction protein A
MTPRAAPAMCPTCRQPIPSGKRCPTCSPDKPRRNARDMGYDRQWEQQRLAHLRLEPFCRYCPAGVLGHDVDHVIPHRGAEWLLRAAWNLQTLCRSCHSRKTAEERNGIPIGMRYPLELTANVERLLFGDVVGWMATASTQKLVVWPEDRIAIPSARCDFLVDAPRHAERTFWITTLGIEGELMLPPKSARRWWYWYELDQRAEAAMKARGSGHA